MRCDRILFPVDFSDLSRWEAFQVAWLARRFDAQITLLHVVDALCPWYPVPSAYYDWDLFNSVVEASKQKLDDFSLDLPKERISRVVLEGEPGYQIIDWVERNRPNLIALGTSRCGTLRGLFLGSVAERVIGNVQCPVWVCCKRRGVKNGQCFEVNKIVCAVEFTEEAVPLLGFAHQVSRTLGAKVILVHSVPELETQLTRYSQEFVRLTEAARVGLAAVQEKAGTNFQTVISPDTITEAIANTATREKADLVVIGRGRCQLHFGRLRTHEYSIIRQTPCPVLSYCGGAEAREYLPAKVLGCEDTACAEFAVSAGCTYPVIESALSARRSK